MSVFFLGGPRWWRREKALLASWITLLSFQRLLGHSGSFQRLLGHSGRLSKESLWPLCWEVSWLGRHSPQARTLMSVPCEGCGLSGGDSICLSLPVWLTAWGGQSSARSCQQAPGLKGTQHVDSGLRERRWALTRLPLTNFQLPCLWSIVDKHKFQWKGNSLFQIRFTWAWRKADGILHALWTWGHLHHPHEG